MRNIVKVFILVILSVQISLSQDIIAVQGAYSPSSIDEGSMTDLNITLTNNSFTPLPVGEVHFTVTFPNSVYNATGTITGGLASYFNLTETPIGSGIWYSTNTQPIPSFIASPPVDIVFEVIGNTAGAELTNLFVDLENLSEDLASQQNNIDNVNLTVNTILPLDFISFKGKAEDCFINNLIWITANEVNNSGFEVERSSDGVHFEKVGFVEAKESNGREMSYSFSEYLEGALINMNIYYRLKQVDFDGRFEYSSTITIKSNCEKAIDFTITPNPATTLVNFNFEGLTSVGTLTIMNDIGELVRKIEVDPNSSYELNVDEFIPGIYTVRGEFDNTFFNKRFIKID